MNDENGDLIQTISNLTSVLSCLDTTLNILERLPQKKLPLYDCAETLITVIEGKVKQVKERLNELNSSGDELSEFEAFKRAAFMEPDFSMKHNPIAVSSE